jgi:hypothetical protein
MLEKLLERISQGGSFSKQSLARELGIGIELLESMLADLVRAGYLRQVERCGESECSGCPTAATCKPRPKVWMLVRKGGK